MEKNSLLERIKAMLKEVAWWCEDMALQPQHRLREDLGMTRLDMTAFKLELDMFFGGYVPEDKEFKTLQDVVDYYQPV